ncbi:hypothetical protein HDU76_002952 [Blyttiomyces sp. JEL0837]|nr:hypothetical protein HDU76_002952 [Blyttiomyces sp. JEL0837]
MPFCISLHIIVNVVAYVISLTTTPNTTGIELMSPFVMYAQTSLNVVFVNYCREYTQRQIFVIENYVQEIYKIDFGAMTPLEILLWREERQTKPRPGSDKLESNSDWCLDASSVPEYPSIGSRFFQSLNYQPSRYSTFASEGGKNSVASMLGYRLSVLCHA